MKREVVSDRITSPDGNDGRKEDEEAEDIDRPLPAESIHGDEQDRECKGDRAEDLEMIRGQ